MTFLRPKRCPQAGVATTDHGEVGRLLAMQRRLRLGRCLVVEPEHHRFSAGQGSRRLTVHRTFRRRRVSSPPRTRITASRNIAVPTTLICGGMSRWAEPHTYIGKVTVRPAFRFVMMKSSKDKEKLSSAAARMPGKTSGNVIRQNVCHSFA